MYDDKIKLRGFKSEAASSFMKMKTIVEKTETVKVLKQTMQVNVSHVW